MRHCSHVALCAALSLLTLSCMMQRDTTATVHESNKRPVIAVPAGTQVPVLSLAFDVSYDPQTDRIVPGYHILQVAIRNNSLGTVQLNPMNDRWTIIDRTGGKHRAILGLRDTNPKVWATLAPRLRQLIEYPIMVEIGTTAAIDLLVPDHIELAEFRRVVFETNSLDRIIAIYPRGSDK